MESKGYYLRELVALFVQYVPRLAVNIQVSLDPLELAVLHEALLQTPQIESNPEEESQLTTELRGCRTKFYQDCKLRVALYANKMLRPFTETDMYALLEREALRPFSERFPHRSTPRFEKTLIERLTMTNPNYNDVKNILRGRQLPIVPVTSLLQSNFYWAVIETAKARAPQNFRVADI